MGIRYVVTVAIITVICLYSASSYAAVQGHVIDSDQNPIEGALVTFTDESNPARSFSGHTDENGWYEIELTPLAAGEDQPQQFQLGQNYPNPFNPTTTIPFSLETSSHVCLTIYNIMGQKIADLADQYMSAGQHTAVWDGMDDEGNHVSAGIYLYRLKAGQHVETRKMLLLDGGGVSGGSVAKPFYGTAKIADGITYTVNITHDSIIPYEETNVEVANGQYRDFIVTQGHVVPKEISFVSIPGGTFQMGDVEGIGHDHEKPIHTVTVSDFDMGIYEVTTAQYVEYLNEALASGDISATSLSVTGVTGDWSGMEYLDVDGDYCKITYNGSVFSVNLSMQNLPVLHVTWFGAKAFANFYGYDLPTEAEFEYACRGGRQYMYGTDDGTIDTSKAKYATKKDFRGPTDVGMYPANPFGLYDMTGNAQEWCHDRFDDYTSESTVNPTGANTGRYRVQRGGGWKSYETWCYSTSRYTLNERNSNQDSGFRVVRRPDGGIAPDIHRIIGKVLFNGSGLQDVTVSFDDKSTQTDSDGEYSFTGLSDGIYTVTFAKEGYMFSPESVDVTVSCSDAMVDDVIATGEVIPVDLSFVSIPGGTFQMGDEVGDLRDPCRPVHTVTVSDFEMSIFEVTNAQYAEYLTAALASGDIIASSLTVKGAKGDWAGEEYLDLSWYCEISFSDGTFLVNSGKENHPVIEVSWYGAKAFANHYGFDLPTEAEWEYACRGGRQYLYGTVDGTINSSLACYDKYKDITSIGLTSDVGSYPANPFGLYDMSGNVWEWCHDWANSYSGESEVNPIGAQSGFNRIYRGGGRNDSAYYCRSALRGTTDPHNTIDCTGFRVVRRPGGVIY